MLFRSPEEMKGCKEAVQVLKDAIKEQKVIAIASDFDCDGIFSSMVLSTTIERLGGKAMIYTPNRVTEGYGLNTRIVDEAVEQGACILLTCDNGIAAFEPVKYAKEKGMTVIITDHHEIPYDEEGGVREFKMPIADVIVNPKQEDCMYPFPSLCGAGVAYKCMSLLIQEFNHELSWIDDVLPYVAIATVAEIGRAHV